MMKIILASIAMLLLAGCATTNTGNVGGASFCSVARPIYWAGADSRLTKEQVDTHNRKGRKLCGWGKKSP